MMKIAVSGKMGAGKTTLAQHFVDKYGFKRTAFAKALKDYAIDIFMLSEEDVFGKKKRALLQDFGQKMREIDELVWINQLLADVEGNEKVVVDDVRYENEYSAMIKEGYLMIRINAPEKLRKERLGDKFQNADHESETSLDNESFDIYIDNIGSVESLYAVAEAIHKEHTTCSKTA